MGIVIENLTYQYPISQEKALENISVTIEQGEFYAIIGPNGGGKTTFCNAIRGFIPHFYKGEFDGDVWIDGKNTKELSIGELALKVGFVFQNPFTQISGVAETVYDEIAFGLENLGLAPVTIRERVENVLSLAKIDNLRDRNPFQLSGGQQQRVALASIIVMEPDILVIDEPTSQLDPQSTEDVFEIIHKMNKLGKTIVLVEHKMELIAQYADRVILLNDGKVVRSGKTKDILTDESILQYETSLPQYASLGIELSKRGVPLSEIPLTQEQAERKIKHLINVHKGGEH